ncbi:MAG: hypothetical protein FJ404_00200 [Verrucomicrobia bacterium]|nr:hypothetical protein [Verrucomicrobiota bacterium]
MKRIGLILPVALCIFALGMTGCKRTLKGPTPIPGQRAQVPRTGDEGFPPVGRGPVVPGGDDASRTTRIGANPDGTFSATGLEEFEGMLKDPAALANYTVYFDFDRFNVKASERSKVEAVAAQLKGDMANKLLIEGHCDSRGTEEYNRSLGERRAQSLREMLAHLGVGPERIRTLSYGEDKPAVQGENEEAWAKNRRGEFILLRPKPQ